VTLLWTLLACVSSPQQRPPPLTAAAVSEQPDLLVTQATRTLAQHSWRGRDEGSKGGLEAQALLVEQLQACGVEPAGEVGFAQAISPGKGTNLIGRVAGSEGGPALLVSAHYDHQDGWVRVHPGAYDNAAAVGLVLQTACALAQSPTRHDVIFGFWDAEEPPTFLTDSMGSRYWAAHPTVPLAEISAVVVLDLTGAGLWDGYPGTFALGSETSPRLAEAVGRVTRSDGLLVHRAGLHLVEKMVAGRDMVWSDYEVFRALGKPVLFMTDGQNKRYHTADDTFEALDLDKLARQRVWLNDLVVELGNGAPPEREDSADLTEDTAVVSHLLTAVLAPDGPAAGWGSVAAGALEASRVEVKALEGRSDLSRAEVRVLRTGAQRLMCWAGPWASRFTCGML
jgi:hypothetical protein